MEKPSLAKRKSHKKVETSTFSAGVAHTTELANLTLDVETSSTSWVQKAKQSVPLAFALYIWNTLTSWVWTFITSPASILIDPLSTTAALVIYPVVWLGLGLATFVFWLAGISGGGQIIENIAEKYAKGYSMVNWVRRVCSCFILPSKLIGRASVEQANPDIFGCACNEAISFAKPMLSGKCSFPLSFFSFFESEFELI